MMTSCDYSRTFAFLSASVISITNNYFWDQNKQFGTVYIANELPIINAQGILKSRYQEPKSKVNHCHWFSLDHYFIYRLSHACTITRGDEEQDGVGLNKWISRFFK